MSPSRGCLLFRGEQMKNLKNTNLLLFIGATFFTLLLSSSPALAAGSQIEWEGKTSTCFGIGAHSGIAGSPIQLQACNSATANQFWTTTAQVGTYGTGYFIKNANGYCLDSLAGSTAAGTPLIIGACGNGGSTHQIWQFLKSTSGYTIKNVKSDMCVDLDKGNPAAGTVIQAYGCNAGSSQNWAYAGASASPAPSPSVKPSASPTAAPTSEPFPAATATPTPNPLPSPAAYILTAPHYTMHVGDLVPPCIVQVTNAGKQVGAGGAFFKGSASCTIEATSASAVGSYAVTVSKGTLTPFNSESSIAVANSTIDVIAADGIGAQLQEKIIYPPGFFSAPRNTVINVTDNGIANLKGDCNTDNAPALLKLLNFGRGTPTATVDTSGTAATYKSGNEFTGILPGSTVTIAGVPYKVASVPSATSMVLTTAPLVNTNVTLGMPPTIVNVSGTAVTAVSGPTLAWMPVGDYILVNQVSYKIASVTDSMHIVLVAAAPTVSNYELYEAPSALADRQVGNQSIYYYFPPGCYATSQQIMQPENFWTFFGSGPQSTYFYLLPNSPVFNAGANVEFFHPQSIGGNDNFHEFLFNIGIRIGAGNPYAVPMTSEQNNVGALRNVQVWADDSNCPFSMSFSRAWAGPALFKNMAMYGCQNALSATQFEMINTLENITTEGQTSVVMNIGAMKLAIRHWLNDNSVQALKLSGSNSGLVNILDSEFVNGGASTPGMTVATGAALYVKNLSSKGYSPTLVDSSNAADVETLTGNIAQHWSGTPQTIFDAASTPDSLHLPEEETPQANDAAPSTWTMLGSDVSQWNAELASGTSPTAYVPPGQYLSSSGSQVIDVPASVNHLQFYTAMRGSVGYVITLNIEGTSADAPLIIDGCLYESCIFNHLTSRTVVINDTTGNLYNAQVGSGNLFVEDSGLSTTTVPVTFYSTQKVWARQLNLEQKGADKIDCVGCTLWALGYKTEQDTTDLVLTAGAKAELFGFFNYQLSVPTAAESSNFVLTDSSLFASGWTEVNISGYGAPDWVTETRSGGNSSSLKTSTTTTNVSLPMFYSFGATKP